MCAEGSTSETIVPESRTINKSTSETLSEEVK